MVRKGGCLWVYVEVLRLDGQSQQSVLSVDATGHARVGIAPSPTCLCQSGHKPMWPCLRRLFQVECCGGIQLIMVLWS